MGKKIGAVWSVIRTDFARRWDAIKPQRGKRKEHGATQESVAEMGGLSRQNAISRILSNKKDGPTVETFVRGLIGMGVKPSDFFLAIEKQLPTQVVPPPWASAANARPTDAPRSPADDALEAQRARLLKAGQYVQRLLEIFAVRDVRMKKHR